MRRNLLIAGIVVALHVGPLPALKGIYQAPAIERVVPVELSVEVVAPATTAVEPPSTTLAHSSRVGSVAPQPLPQPPAIDEVTPSSNAPTGIIAPAPSLAPAAIPTGEQQALAAPPAPAALELPSSAASYLQNPKPIYPPMSKRLGEQGKVTVRAFIESNGTVLKAEINQSSGYDRLDQAALATVLRWRFVPGTRAGVPEAMWFNVPINFILE